MRKSRMGALLGSVLAFSLVGMGTANAAPPAKDKAPTPKGQHYIAPGTSVTMADPDTGTVTYVAGTSTTTSAATAQAAGIASAATFATTCWSVTNWINWGNPRLMAYNQQVDWCGNGSKVTAVSQKIWGSVTAYGSASGWGYDGILSQDQVNYYNGWAYQDVTQGKFSQCYAWCFNHKYPVLTTNVYADGGWALWGSG